MANPTPYDPAYSFAGYQSTNPERPLPGVRVDDELANIATSMDDTQTALADVRRSDGALKNGIVTQDSLSSEVTLGIYPTTPWVSGAIYTPKSTVFVTDTVYRATLDHVAGVTFATDLAAGKWLVAADFGPIVDKAKAWAEQVPDPVETGPDQFSAKYWAQEAADIVIAGLAEASAAEARGGTVTDRTITPRRVRDAVPLETTTIQCDITGTNALVFTPKTNQPAFSALVDGMRFSGMPPNTSPIAIMTAEVAGIGGVKTLRGPDGYANMLWGDVQKNKRFTMTYNASLDRFVQEGEQTFKQSLATHGRVKLQSDSQTRLSLTQDNGQGLILGNPLTGGVRPVALPSITETNVFAGANYLVGVNGSSLTTNKLWVVYAFNVDGGNEQDVALDFYPMYNGAAGASGGATWLPIVNEYGYYVKPVNANGTGGSDNTRTYVGMIGTDDTSIESVINGSTEQVHVCGVFNKWPFDMVSGEVVTAPFTTSNNGLQSTPRSRIVTDGISHTPKWHFDVSAYGSAAGQTITLGIQITGTAYDGSPFSHTTPLRYATAAIPNSWVHLTASYGVAVPMGVFTARPVITVDGGTWTVRTNLLTTMCL